MVKFHSIRGNQLFLAATVVVALINLWLIYNVSPMIRDQQMAQKIFYYHVPLAWNAFLAYSVTGIAAIMYLRKGEPRWDRWSLAGAEIGTTFALLILLTGPIWATPIWGKSWSWEPRLTTTLILFLIFMGYFMVREFGGPYERASRYAAVVALLGLADVPLILSAVKWWAPEVQSHPQMEMLQQSALIQQLFLFSLASFTLILVHLIRYRHHAGELEYAHLQKQFGDGDG